MIEKANEISQISALSPEDSGPGKGATDAREVLPSAARETLSRQPHAVRSMLIRSTLA
jgi:hypothetical protein